MESYNISDGVLDSISDNVLNGVLDGVSDNILNNALEYEPEHRDSRTRVF